MHVYIKRKQLKEILHKLKKYPVTALLGPRQTGKSTLAKQIQNHIQKTIYFDLQDPRSLRRMEDPIAIFEQYENSLIILDEIQKMPELFSVMRSLIDKKRKNGQVLILGSASRDLIQQSSETLAGRICYLEITPFQRSEVQSLYKFNSHLLKGGFPLSLMADNNQDSFDWRKNYIQTFLERDIPSLGMNSLPPYQMGRLWRMLAHHHGQVLNVSKLSQSMGFSSTTLKKYISFLAQTFVIRLLEPYHSNLKKRIVKTPKVYIRDSGLLHALLDIENMEDLMGHPVYGASFEGFIIENLVSQFPSWIPSFLRTSNGAEIDLILSKGKRNIFFEIKVNSAPKISKSLYQFIEIIKPCQSFVIAPVFPSYRIKDIFYISMDDFLNQKITLSK